MAASSGGPPPDPLRGPGRGRAERETRAVRRHAGRAAQAPGARRGGVLLPAAARTRTGEPWRSADWDAEPDWEWSSASSDTPEQLYALWEGAVARSRANLRQALDEGGLGGLGRRTWPDGRAPSPRRILVDVIEEYARHVGHDDLVRESVDGRVGEDPPAS
ncbi:DinB family protein [Streptomyces fulvoviolaceus]|uniref:DinB family protein n=1 Tax=Streptomyces fulvoviolaceus TaxID=285535 RepID=UPI0021BFD886|nr:DinB family protein [Streptomyces fulvoviolaceus]MCT9084533.1 DinB family protein [Streptomyces fulvoviolaceus]